MITPMIKYTFLLHHAERERLLEELGHTAIVDITMAGWQADDSDKAMLSAISRTHQTLEKLKSYIASNKVEGETINGSDTPSSVDDILSFFEANTARSEQLMPLIQKCNKDIQDLGVWGSFDVKLIDKLVESGVFLHYFTVSDSKFDAQWEVDYNLIVCGSFAGVTSFVVVSDSSDAIELHDARRAKPLTESVTDKKLELERAESELAKVRVNILSLEGTITTLEEHEQELKEELSKRKVIQTSVEAAQGEVVVITGWAPVDRCEQVDALFESNDSVVLFKDEPTEDEEPPILLKNSKFARLSEVITRLYSMPKYRAQDLTPFFAPFFIFFVGICMCDLGYGLLIFIAAIVAKVKAKDGAAKDIASLIMWCCLATVIMGALTGTFFGMTLANYEMFDGVPFLGQMDMFSFSLVVGIIQILYAMIIKGAFEIKTRGIKAGISTLSWAGAIIAGCVAFMGEDLGINFSMDSPVFKALMGLFLLLYILFINPAKKPYANIGSGMWSLYNAITGLLGDVLSYIRLFALGLSGGIIAGVFNELAIAMSGDVPVLKYVIMLLILLIGHSVNLFMSAISSFVHPLRLTLVEFYKCAGFEAGGTDYNPFKLSRKSAK